MNVRRCACINSVWPGGVNETLEQYLYMVSYGWRSHDRLLQACVSRLSVSPPYDNGSDRPIWP